MTAYTCSRSRPFLEQVASRWSPGPVVVTVPTTSNPNLHAQAGLFTLVRYPKRSKKVAIPPPLDRLFKRKANRVASQETPNLVPQPMMFQFTLAVTEAPALLHYLHLHGIDAAHVYPGLKSVSKAMKESKLRSKVTPGRTLRVSAPHALLERDARDLSVLLRNLGLFFFAYLRLAGRTRAFGRVRRWLRCRGPGVRLELGRRRGR